MLSAGLCGQRQVQGTALLHAISLLQVEIDSSQGLADGRRAQGFAGSPAEEAVGGVVDGLGFDVVLQEVEVAVIETPQQVSAGPQHNTPVCRTLALGQLWDQGVLDVVEGLK